MIEELDGRDRHNHSKDALQNSLSGVLQVGILEKYLLTILVNIR